MRRMQQDRSPLAPAAEGIPGATLTLPPESEARYPPDSKAVTPKRKLRTSFHHSVDQEKAKRTTDAQTEAEPGTEREGSFNGHILEQVRPPLGKLQKRLHLSGPASSPCQAQACRADKDLSWTFCSLDA